MPRAFKAYLVDIDDAIRKIEKYTKALSYKKFIENELILDGVVRNLEVIGEAVKQIPDDIKNKKSEIKWKKIAGLRDILIHSYFGIDTVIVWDIVANKIPELKHVVQEILSEINDDTPSSEK